MTNYNPNKNKKNKGKKAKNNTETTTLPIANIEGSIINNYPDNKSEYQLYEVYKKIIEIETNYQQLSSQIKSITTNINSIRKKENSLLNKFGWTLIMANILLGVLAFVVVLGYFQFIYPELQKNINSEGAFEFIKWIMFGILAFLAGIWWSVMKFANYVRKRDQGEEPE